MGADQDRGACFARPAKDIADTVDRGVEASLNHAALQPAPRRHILGGKCEAHDPIPLRAITAQGLEVTEQAFRVYFHHDASIAPDRQSPASVKLGRPTCVD